MEDVYEDSRVGGHVVARGVKENANADRNLLDEFPRFVPTSPCDTPVAQHAEVSA